MREYNIKVGDLVKYLSFRVLVTGWYKGPASGLWLIGIEVNETMAKMYEPAMCEVISESR